MIERVARTTRLGLIALLTTFFLAFAATPSSAQVGVGAGLNFSSLGDATELDGGQEGVLDRSTGFHVGGFYNLNVGPIGLRPGAYFRQVGTYELPDSEDVFQSFDVNLIEFPIDAQLRVFTLPLVQPYILAGPVFSIPFGEGDFGDATEDVLVSADIGVGAEISVPGVQLTLTPELRYGVGGTQFLEDQFEIGDRQFAGSEADALTSVVVRLGVMFR